MRGFYDLLRWIMRHPLYHLVRRADNDSVICALVVKGHMWCASFKQEVAIMAEIYCT